MALQQSVEAPTLTENALVVLKKRYLKKNEYGEVAETPEEMFRRVANSVAEAELIYARIGRRRQTERSQHNRIRNRFTNEEKLVEVGKACDDVRVVPRGKQGHRA